MEGVHDTCQYPKFKQGNREGVRKRKLYHYQRKLKVIFSEIKACFPEVQNSVVVY